MKKEFKPLYNVKFDGCSLYFCCGVLEIGDFQLAAAIPFDSDDHQDMLERGWKATPEEAAKAEIKNLFNDKQHSYGMFVMTFAKSPKAKQWDNQEIMDAFLETGLCYEVPKTINPKTGNEIIMLVIHTKDIK